LSTQAPQKSNRRLGLVLAGVVTAMFGVGFAMVPLYSLICDAAGINKAGGGGRVSEAQVARLGVDYKREVRVEFDATLNADLDWQVTPKTPHMMVHPGKPYEVHYSARNNTDHEVVAQAIPGITPWQATEYFNKIACFCFSQQKLAPGESADLTLRFVLSPELPDKYKTVTLSYTFMDTDRDKLIHAVSAR
jgi:cytochrome c oxidase assembly protein subunit 11